MRRRFLIQLEVEDSGVGTGLETGMAVRTEMGIALADLRWRIKTNDLAHVTGRLLECDSGSKIWALQMEELDLTAQPEPEPTTTYPAKFTPRQHAMLLAACRHMEEYACGIGERLAYTDLAVFVAGLTTQAPEPAQTQEDCEYIAAARAMYDTDDDQVINDHAKVTHCDEGAFVEAWFWVPENAIIVNTPCSTCGTTEIDLHGDGVCGKCATFDAEGNRTN
jgi:ribosomal protein S27AE